MGKTEASENVTKLKNMKAFFVLPIIFAFFLSCLFFSCNNGSEKIVYVPAPAPNDGETATPAGGETQSGVITLVTEATIVDEIKKMTESGTVKASGLFDSKLIEDVKNAINYLADERPNVLVTLDLSAVKGLSKFSFANCKNLAGIVLPNDKTNMTSIGADAFKGCSRLTSVTIPSNVTYIGADAFYGCAGLESVTIEERGNILFVVGGAFSGCKNISVNYKGTLAQWCNFPGVIPNVKLCMQEQEIKDLVIPDGVTSICDHAFYGCSGITSVTIPGSVTSIGFNAFYGCTGLTSVTIPGSVTSIGLSAFSGCTGLTSCNYTGTLEQWCKISFSSSASNPCSCAKKLCIQGQEIKDLVIPDGVTSIGYDAFYGCAGIASVTIPGSVTSIGNCAFYGCAGIASVTIPGSVTSIGYDAFYGCKNLENAIFSDTSGWYYSYSSGLTGGTAISSASLADSTTAALYLRDTYCRCYWYKNN